ncbi:unnamed protein product [Protopolystoma xenopodis]|uniref:Uncharacterized protein n=1 Tax=Protopolystoma xenopodis TaxID=117903 RepID=A0A3S5AY90_9PLAT|nr:unnamed protein product [Protopolystoma xenopodis]
MLSSHVLPDGCLSCVYTSASLNRFSAACADAVDWPSSGSTDPAHLVAFASGRAVCLAGATSGLLVKTPSPPVAPFSLRLLRTLIGHGDDVSAVRWLRCYPQTRPSHPDSGPPPAKDSASWPLLASGSAGDGEICVWRYEPTLESSASSDWCQVRRLRLLDTASKKSLNGLDGHVLLDGQVLSDVASSGISVAYRFCKILSY